MKKITTSLVIILSLFLFNKNTNAQAFQKGNMNLDVGIGFGIYGTSQSSTTSFSAGGVTTSESHDTTDGAASMLIPLSFEYGINDKMGLGADFVYNNYIIDEEDRENLESVRAIDFGAKFNYHLLNSDRNDLFIGVGLGISNISWNYKSDAALFVESASGTGVYYSVGITDRIFFSDNIGILFNISYKGYNYSNIEANLTSEAEAVITAFGITDYSQKWAWSFNGVDIGTGLAFKF